MEHKFWLENVGHLFLTPKIIPVKGDSLESEMNSLTRLVMFLYVLLLLLNFTIDVRFLVIALILIILVYYMLRSLKTPVCKENYGPVNTVLEPIPPTPWNSNTNDFVFTEHQDSARNRCQYQPEEQARVEIPSWNNNPQLMDVGNSSAWCPKNLPIEETISDNQLLVGPPNPKTLTRPIIPSPIYDFEVWKANDFIIPTGINDQKRQELFDNGYVTTQPIAKTPIPVTHQQYFQPNSSSYGVPSYEGSSRVPIEHVEDETRESYTSPSSVNPGSYKTFTVDPIDRGCGYNPSNVQYNLPVNYKTSACDKTNAMKEYNQNLFTIPIQPGIYTKSQVNQTDASMANLGISYQQPFLPTNVHNHGTYKTFLEYDPSMAPPCQQIPIAPQEPMRNEIYDPRLTGYGTSYRSYIEPVTGQARFYYDDIDQQTQYNYLTRNDIDFGNFGTSVGPMKNTSLQGDQLHAYADNMYTENAMSYRTELQQRLMHKNSNREWQQRIAPITTMRTARASMGTNSSKSYAGPRGG